MARTKALQTAQSQFTRHICNFALGLACVTSHGSEPSAGLWLRGLPGESSDYKYALAELARPLWITTRRRQTLQNHVVDVCGELPTDLLESFTSLAGEYNGVDILEQPISEGVSLAIPFCTKVEGPEEVELNAGGTLSDLLQKYTGLFGAVSVRTLVAKTTHLAEDQVDSEMVERFSTSVYPGQKFAVDFVAPQRFIRPESEAAAEQIVHLVSTETVEGFTTDASATRLRQAEFFTDVYGVEFVSLHSENLFPDPEINTTYPDIDAVNLVEPVSLSGADQTCGGPADWEYFKSQQFLDRFTIESEFLAAEGRPLETAIVGVVDSGLLGFGTWPFLEARFFKNSAEVGIGTQPNVSDDLNVFIDDIWGINFVSQDGSLEPFATDDRVREHGTQIMSIMLGGEAVSNFPIAGNVAKSIVVNFGSPTGNGMQNAVELNRAVRYLKDRGAEIINLSLSSKTKLAYTDINPNILFTVAAGNAGQDLNGLERYPALLGGNPSNPNFITVGAIDRDDNRANFSNYGETVDLFAPGCGIPAWNGTGFIEDHGTSLSSAHVAFVASWIKGLAGDLMFPKRIKERLLASADYSVLLEFGDTSLQGQNGLVLNPVKAVSLTHSVLETNSGLRFVRDTNTAVQLGAHCDNQQTRQALQNIVKFTPNLTIPGRDGLWVRYVIRNPGQSIKFCKQSAEPSTLSFGGQSVPVTNVRDFVLQEF